MKTKRHPRKKNWLEYFIINIFVFAGIGLLSFIIFNVSLFNPLVLAFKDFTLTDMYYSRIQNHEHDHLYNGPLVIVNIENRSRAEISFLVDKLEKGDPKVLGFDVIFGEKKDSSGEIVHSSEDSLLKTAFAKYSNLVFPYVGSFDKTAEGAATDSFFQVSSPSFVNLIGDSREHSTLRYYYPVYKNTPAFTTAVLQKYDPSIAAPLLKKNNKKTEIHYWGNLQEFHYQTFDEVMDPSFNTDMLKGKIILLGYAGLNGDAGKLDEDRFFTPLNEQLSGRSHPDMYGLVVNANILRMGLDKDFVYVLPTWINWVIAFSFSWLLLPLFVRWYVHRAVWFHLFTMLLQLLISIAFVFFSILLYAKLNIKIESSEVLVAVLLLVDFLLFYDHLVKFLKYKLKWNFHSKFFEGGH